MIDVQALRVGYAGTQVIKGLTLRIGEGSVGLLGPNGAGKSTLIKTLLGHLKPSGGGGTVLGLDIRRRFLDIRQRVGYMPERDCIFPGMNGVTSVTFAGQLVGMSRSDAKQRAHEVLNYVELADERYRPVDSYSAGMLQRIKLAQALVHDPKLLFLDEPTNGMDPRGRTEMLDLIRDVSTSKGIHVLLSSHLLPDVEEVCENVVVLAGGEVLETGNIEAMRERAGGRYVVRVKGDREAFGATLTAAGCSVEPGPRGAMKVGLADGASTDLLLKTARDQGIQIRHLEPSRRSLEDVFMEALERDAGGETAIAAAADSSTSGVS